MNMPSVVASIVPPIVELRNLDYGFLGPDGTVHVLRNANLKVQSGEFIVILGASGSGKSTLMNLIGGLDRATGGEIFVHGRDICRLSNTELEKYRREELGFVFQFFNLMPSLTAIENVVLALEALDSPPSDRWERARYVLQDVGLADKLHRYPSQLSGGEQQRVAIARALVRNAPLILADEPTGNLDEDTAWQVMDLFASIQRGTRATLLLITHDPNIATLADRVVQLTHGVLQEKFRVAA